MRSIRWSLLVWLAGVPACFATTLTLYPYHNPSVPGTSVVIQATVTGVAPPTGRFQFLANGAAVPNCDAKVPSGTGNVRFNTCTLFGLAPGLHNISVTYSGDSVNPPAITSVIQRVNSSTVPSAGVIKNNPYGAVQVTGAALIGNVIDRYTNNIEIRLGSQAGPPGQAFEIEFATFDLAGNVAFTVYPGAPGQAVVLRVLSAPSAIGGGLYARTLFGSQATIPAPSLYFHNPAGLSINDSAGIAGAGRVTVDTLGGSWMEGAAFVNSGNVFGEPLEVRAAQITGGAYYTSDLTLRSFGNINWPRYGAYYYDNGLAVYPPNSPSPVALTLNAYGNGPQVVNVSVRNNNGQDLTVSMPSSWPPGSTSPPNNPPVAPGATRGASVPDPAYGGGSLIVSAIGALRLAGSATMDLAFPGAIVLRSQSSIDTAGVLVNQGWTTSGRTFQGIFFEAPQIRSSAGPIAAYTNAANWINFSTLPLSPVSAFELARNPDGSASFSAADATAPHLNNYFVMQQAAANGECWTCLVNPQPVDMSGGPSCVLLASNAQPVIGSAIVLSASCTGNPTAYTWGGVSCSMIQCLATSSTPGPRTYSVTASNAAGAGPTVFLTVQWLPGPTALPGVGHHGEQRTADGLQRRK